MISRHVILSLLLVLAESCFSPLRADLANTSFENGQLNGWGTVGIAGVGDESSNYFAPTDGVYYAMIESSGLLSPSAGVSEIESFLNLPVNALNAFSAEPIFQGSAISQSITVNAGDVLSFNYLIATNNIPDDDEFYGDVGFFVVGGKSLPSLSIPVGLATDPSPSLYFTRASAWTEFQYIFEASGTYEIAFGILDVGDATVNSALLIDNVRVQSVPEPSSVALALPAFAGLTWAARWRKNRSMSPTP